MTADCTAGVDPMVPDSPMPFAPSKFSGVGVSMWITSMLGSSAAEMNAYSAKFEDVGFPSAS